MGLFDSLLGNDEKTYKETWKKIIRIDDAEQLELICISKQNYLMGGFAFLWLFEKHPYKADDLARKNEYSPEEGFPIYKIKRMATNEIILIGIGTEFDEIRRIIKKVKEKYEL